MSPSPSLLDTRLSICDGLAARFGGGLALRYGHGLAARYGGGMLRGTAVGLLRRTARGLLRCTAGGLLRGMAAGLLRGAPTKAVGLLTQGARYGARAKRLITRLACAASQRGLASPECTVWRACARVHHPARLNSANRSCRRGAAAVVRARIAATPLGRGRPNRLGQRAGRCVRLAGHCNGGRGRGKAIGRVVLQVAPGIAP
mmetsp:Transcript_15382/g.45282  ORF Transcript_15382/g.45282 Transcript_15382/m.45282 type:complete len:202 (+) Transcript_15382:354-959(+)